MSRFRVPVLCAAWLLAARLPGQDLTVVSKTTAPGLSAPARYSDGRRLAAVALGPMGALFQRMYEELKKVTGFPLSTAVIFQTPGLPHGDSRGGDGSPEGLHPAIHVRSAGGLQEGSVAVGEVRPIRGRRTSRRPLHKTSREEGL